MAKTLSEICEELCPGSRKRNWPSWAGPWRHDYEDDFYYVEQLGASWTVHYKSTGEVCCFRPDKESAIDFCKKSQAKRVTTPTPEREEI